VETRRPRRSIPLDDCVEVMVKDNGRGFRRRPPDRTAEVVAPQLEAGPVAGESTEAEREHQNPVG
jgi:hypothetical protein